MSSRLPSSLGGGDTDKHLIYEGLSRVASDAVVAGAETIRGSDVVFSVWHRELIALRASLGKPRHPMQVLATLRGLDFEHMLLLNGPEFPWRCSPSRPASRSCRMSSPLARGSRPS